MIARALAVFAALLVVAAPVFGAQPHAAIDAALAKNQPQQLHDFLDFVALPDDAVVPADVAKNAAWLRAALIRSGMQAQLLENDAEPMVFAA